jgi:acyl-coenzyme A synthetase/AMP-(fatty) acid ligase
VRELPAAKVPRCIVVVRELPRTSRGKLLHADVERLLGIVRPGGLAT